MPRNKDLKEVVTKHLELEYEGEENLYYARIRLYASASQMKLVDLYHLFYDPGVDSTMLFMRSFNALCETRILPGLS